MPQKERYHFQYDIVSVRYHSGAGRGARVTQVRRVGDLERALASIPPHPAPKAALEQYATPADVAAPLLFEAFAAGDLEGRSVLDLGCGTGVLAIGAAVLGAGPVVGVDLDPMAVDVARREAARLGADVRFEVADVASWEGRVDTVVMNPPFGAQRRGADRPFLEAAFALAGVVYSIHNAPTREFVEMFAASHGFAVTHRWRMLVALRHQYAHQSRPVRDLEVVALRMAREGSATSHSK